MSSTLVLSEAKQQARRRLPLLRPFDRNSSVNGSSQHTSHCGKMCQSMQRAMVIFSPYPLLSGLLGICRYSSAKRLPWFSDETSSTFRPSSRFTTINEAQPAAVDLWPVTQSQSVMYKNPSTKWTGVEFCPSLRKTQTKSESISNPREKKKREKYQNLTPP